MSIGARRPRTSPRPATSFSFARRTRSSSRRSDRCSCALPPWRYDTPTTPAPDAPTVSTQFRPRSDTRSAPGSMRSAGTSSGLKTPNRASSSPCWAVRPAPWHLSARPDSTSRSAWPGTSICCRCRYPDAPATTTTPSTPPSSRCWPRPAGRSPTRPTR